MNQKQLTNAIRDGMTQSRDDFWKEVSRAIWYALGIIFLGLILIFAWNQYHEWRFERDYCGGEPCPQGTTQQQDNCNFPYLTCEVYQEKRFYKCQDGLIHETSFYIETQEESNITKIDINVNDSILPCADISDQIPIKTAYLCGYQEANAWFEQIRERHPQYQLSKLKMECK